MAVPVNSATSGVGYGVQNGVRFCAHRHARGHHNSPPDCCYPDGLPCSSLSILSNKKSKAKSLAFFIGADYETRPVRFCAHRHARGHRNSPPDCCYPGGLPCSSLAQRYYEQKSTRRNALCFLLERITRLARCASARTGTHAGTATVPRTVATLAGCPVRVLRKDTTNKKAQGEMPCAFCWSGLRDSNSLPPPWQGGALPDELNPQTIVLLYPAGAGLSSPFLPMGIKSAALLWA